MNPGLKAFIATVVLVAIAVLAGLLVYWLLFPVLPQQWQLWLAAIAVAILLAAILFVLATKPSS